MKSVALLFMFCCLTLRAQTKRYDGLLSVAFGKYDRIVVCKKAIHISFYEENINWITKYFKMNHRMDLDTTIISQLIQNSQFTDTTEWMEEELPNFLLVNFRTENVSTRYAINKFSLTDKKQTRLCRKQIRRFNFIQDYDRDIFYFSRPVFDNSKSFAIIKWDNGHSGLSGGGGIILYQFVDSKWATIGELESWYY